MAQSVEHLSLSFSAQVVISQLVGRSPASGSELAVNNLLGILRLPLSAPPPLMFPLAVSLSLFLSLSKYVSKLLKNIYYQRLGQPQVYYTGHHLPMGLNVYKPYNMASHHQHPTLS